MTQPVTGGLTPPQSAGAYSPGSSFPSDRASAAYVPHRRADLISAVGLVVTLLLVAATGCSASSVYVYPTQVTERFVITTGDVDRPYRSLGYIQLTRKGADILGFIPIVSADLETMFGRELIRELERTGADGIINVRFYERQWTVAQRLLFLITIISPVPTHVELTGELIQFVPEAEIGPPGAAPPPAP